MTLGVLGLNGLIRIVIIYLSSLQSSKITVLNHAGELWIPVCPLVDTLQVDKIPVFIRTQMAVE